MQGLLKKSVAVVACLLLSGIVQAQSGPDGNWNIKIKVGHVGEGIRPVILQIKDNDGELAAMMSKLNGRMDVVDELKYDVASGEMYLAFGSYEYNLIFEDDRVRGSVESPAGKQSVTGSRQESLRLLGDEVEPLRRSWTGTIQSADGALILKTRLGFDTYFTNIEEFRDQLSTYEGKSIRVTGWWMKTMIKIQSLEDGPS
jgi:hypothetical protein